MASPLEILTFVDPMFQENTFLLYDRPEGHACVVDPGLPPQADLVQKALSAHRLTLTHILLTHGHGDHIVGAAQLKRDNPGAKVCIAEADAPMLNDPQLNLSAAFATPISLGLENDGDLVPGLTLVLAGADWRVLDTSGHTPGGRSFHCPAHNLVIVGDALFRGGVGRTDFPGGDPFRLMANIQKHLLTLGDATGVLCGHGPATTIGVERRNNPFLIRPNAPAR